MSAYAALVSLLQILATILDGGRSWSIHNRAQLHSLHEKVIFFLDFLDNSSTYKATQISALETKMREAAYRAEDLLQSQISRISGSASRRLRVLMVMTMINFLLSFAILRNWIDVSLPQAMPDWIKIFMLRILLPVLAAIPICTILAVVLNVALRESNFEEINGIRAQETQDLRLVLYDFNVMVKEVVRIKGARGRGDDDLDMSAYAALLSLRKILDSILESGEVRMSHNRAQIKSLHEKVTFLLDFLENTSAKSAPQIPEATITDAVYKAQQIIEFQIPSQLILDSDKRRFRRLVRFILLAILFSVFASVSLTTTRDWTQFLVGWVIAVVGFGVVALGANVSTTKNKNEMLENKELCLVIDDLSIIVKDATKIKDACGDPSDQLPTASSSTKRDLGGTGKNVVVGLERDMEQIKARLIQDSANLEVISIVGMGGIGKTTLATQVYNDLDIAFFFDIRAWLTISQEYSLRHVILGLLDSARILTKQMQEDNDERLGEHLHKNLKGRRYLIVIDDVWDTEIWDFLRRFMPDDHNRSRVLLTSRLSDVASYPDSRSPLHQMQCLNEDESWYLLREKVFGAEGCPFLLESIGREIARSCRGLPLAILVIGGLLYKDKRSLIWREVAENLSLKLRQIEDHCLEILGLSYNHLPHHLRPCFLYMGVFLGDGEIPGSRLISLWAAEGFLKPCTSKSLEEVGEDYLKDLIDRNLILACKRSCNGKIRTYRIHDLLRDVCVENASKENFFLVMDGGGYTTRVRPEQTPRRLSIRPDALQVNGRHDLISSYYYVRSFLCTASELVRNPSVVYLGFPYLRVLDVLAFHFGQFPHQIIKLVCLRYLAFHYNGSLPPSISKLRNLETIVHYNYSFNKYPMLPRVVWSMPNLRHLYVRPGCYFSDPLGYRLQWKSSILEHLQTLIGIRNFKLSKSIIKRIPNLKKLEISYDSVDWSKYQLESLVDLHQLETLKILTKSPICHDAPKLAFPEKLKKLTLSGCGIPWASMTAVGALPNLEALKLRCEAFCGSSWETVEGEFPKLMFLLLEEMNFTSWKTDAEHFPRLQRLVIRSCGLLDEIPFAIGDIPTLEMIELVNCHPCAVDSAKEIQREQASMGNEDIKFDIERGIK
ncbi:putative late blight resistance protein homolog R1B-16 [Salvia miltiorrhiza]|uniref:putative late blight resistance protein homolog R1B-16 n=1 Tax=Salvia miltiorrhiza TaxID=226208 RepID=UPI0025AC3D85|nr:putative late blight resistance protein homolog R1B-16 [Salvia miltiorrhiza]